jgi:hypothetical protein
MAKAARDAMSGECGENETGRRFNQMRGGEA